MGNKVNLSWDGEKIKQTVIVDDEKFSPKDIVDGYYNAINQVGQIKEQKVKSEQQMKQLDNNIVSINAFIADRKEFIEKAEEIMIDKLKFYISSLSTELIAQAEKEALIMINKDPNAYTEEHKINQKYVLYQRFLAIDKKVAANISSKLIQKYIFETPLFDNPFKG